MAIHQTQVNKANKTFKDNVDLLRQFKLHLSDNATNSDNQFTAQIN